MRVQEWDMKTTSLADFSVEITITSGQWQMYQIQRTVAHKYNQDEEIRHFKEILKNEIISQLKEKDPAWQGEKN